MGRRTRNRGAGSGGVGVTHLRVGLKPAEASAGLWVCGGRRGRGRRLEVRRRRARRACGGRVSREML